MKRHIARLLFASIVMLSMTGIEALFADEITTNLESIIVQNFDDAAKEPWFAIASKFSTSGFPKIAYANTWPDPIYGRNPPNKDSLHALGVAMLFDRREYNWVDLVPGKKEGEGDNVKYSPTEFPLPGRTQMIDVWVWSGNFDYYLEAYVRDYKGIVYTIPMGNLTFSGWRNLKAYMPDNIPQAKKYLPRTSSLTFVKFRIWTRPTETAASFTSDPKATDMDRAVKFYIDNIKILTDTFESPFDGDALMQKDFLEKTWGAEKK